MNPWRLLLDGAATGAWNMAVDEALLLSAPKNHATLRFYDWQPSCLSLGRFQKWDEVLQNRADSPNAVNHSNDELPFDVVRRPTGGRAVWHQMEITYCAVLREDDLPRDARSIAGAYRWLSGGFLDGLQSLGIDAMLADASSADASSADATHQTSAPSASAPSASAPSASAPSASALSASALSASAPSAFKRQTPNCFSTATRADFVVSGRKLIGAAQVRRNGIVLQHGSLLLDLDEAAWRHAIGGSLRDVVTLRALGVATSKAQIIEALCEGCARSLNVRFEEETLSRIETETAGKLCRDKYSCAAWNRHARPDDAALCHG